MRLDRETIDRMVKDAEFVGPNHPYAPQLFSDLCCHIKALACDVIKADEQIASLERMNEDCNLALRDVPLLLPSMDPNVVYAIARALAKLTVFGPSGRRSAT